MAAKLFQRSWRSASAIDSARLISSVSHWAPASESPSLRSTQDPPTIHNTRPVSRFTLSSLVAHNNLLLQATDDHHGHSSSHHRYLSTFASPLRNLADPKRDHHNNKSIHEPYVMNLTVRDSNVIKLGTSDRQPANANDGDRVEKLGLIKRFKALYKQYWYVMLPVHVVTSTGWMVGFYYLSQSGVDVPELLRHINISETIVAKMENSPTGHLAIAYLCYKIATPVRYMVTIGGTTVSINYLSRWGLIKPIPSKENLIKMYDAKAAQVKKSYGDAMTNYKKGSGSSGSNQKE